MRPSGPTTRWTLLERLAGAWYEAGTIPAPAGVSDAMAPAVPTASGTPDAPSIGHGSVGTLPIGK